MMLLQKHLFDSLGTTHEKDKVKEAVAYVSWGTDIYDRMCILYVWYAYNLQLCILYVWYAYNLQFDLCVHFISQFLMIITDHDIPLYYWPASHHPNHHVIAINHFTVFIYQNNDFSIA